MLIKAMLVPLILIICFGGGMVALTKPFNSKAVSLVALLAVSLGILGYGHGLIKLVGAVGLLLALYGIFAIRGKR